MMVRQAFSRVQKKQKRKYGWIVGGLAVLVVAIGGVAIYQQRQASQQKAMAEELFYAMKSLDVDIANVQRLVMESNNQRGIEEVRKYQDRRKEMEKNYDRFLTALKVYDTRGDTGRTADSPCGAHLWRVRTGDAARFRLRDQVLHPEVAGFGAVEERDPPCARERIYPCHHERTARPGFAAAVLLPCAAGKRFGSVYQRPA
jgi:hypothetical protein